jgi:hypothetical protein
MNLFKKLFLIREIISKKGELHFQRYRLLATPFLNIYVHRLCKSDREKHMHDHPWSFITLILWRGYMEYMESYPEGISRKWLHIVYHKAEEVHKFKLLDETKSTWTLVITGPRRREWGYKVGSDWFDNQTYRELKQKNEL